jgi:3-oxoadipate enol-lactonase
MSTAHVNGIELYFERRGSGPRLLFVNGSGATVAGSGAVLRPFADRFDLVVHDQRGLGRSAHPPGPYTMADYAADALGLLDHLGWESCRVVGLSFGGMVAQELAVTEPDRTERLALLCTSPGGSGGSSFPLHELDDLGPDERATRLVRLLDTRFTPEWLASHPQDQALVDYLAAQYTAEPSPEARRGEQAQLEARRHHDVVDRLGRITAPTLVASGRYDGIAPPDNGRAIAERIPGARLALYEGGHAFVAQDPAALPEIVTFLGDG